MVLSFFVRKPKSEIGSVTVHAAKHETMTNMLNISSHWQGKKNALHGTFMNIAVHRTKERSTCRVINNFKFLVS